MKKKISVPQPLSSLMEGIEHGALTNFYGAPGTGKTNICLISALEVVKGGGKVVFLDTEGGFSHERFSQLSDNPEHVNGITMLEPKDFKEQSRMIKSLKDVQADLIVVDSAAALYRLEYSDPEKEALEANRELSKQMSILSAIAREKDIPVIVTSHTYKNWDTENNEIVGGDAVKYWAKAVIFLERTGKMSERNATVVKHRWIHEGKSVKFEIVNNGIKPSGGRFI
ncbi:MAG: DNA repair and recombination protein RadB [Candidatus Aenigmarchaeota archaeon]|nr:DNA repair and recombination protein RadB [Candidatus Aenigmarchaeota archaeon]